MRDVLRGVGISILQTRLCKFPPFVLRGALSIANLTGHVARRFVRVEITAVFLVFVQVE